MTNKICAKIQEGRKTTCNRKINDEVVEDKSVLVVTLLRLVVSECGSMVGIGQR